MTNAELWSTINKLTPIEKYAFANAILDSLAEEGSLPLSDKFKSILDDRAKNADEHPESLIPAEQVFSELRSQKKLLDGL
jgi:putative addiction module component (TIGR02574 family)